MCSFKIKYQFFALKDREASGGAQETFYLDQIILTGLTLPML
jgi:hypothetical protein